MLFVCFKFLKTDNFCGTFYFLFRSMLSILLSVIFVFNKRNVTNNFSKDRKVEIFFFFQKYFFFSKYFFRFLSRSKRCFWMRANDHQKKKTVETKFYIFFPSFSGSCFPPSPFIQTATQAHTQHSGFNVPQHALQLNNNTTIDIFLLSP